MRLDELIKDLECLASFRADGSIAVEEITNDSKKVDGSALFIAIRGTRHDGHAFLSEVLAQGGRAAIVEEIDESVAIAQYQVANARRAFSRLSSAFFGHPTRDLYIHGITATNGKTTIAFMLDEILRAHGLATGLIGTVKIRLGDQIIPAAMTTPESFELQGYFDKMRQAGVESVTMEVSSLALEQHRCDDVAFDVVSFNNFSREHIDQHGSLEAYWQAKASLITAAASDTVTLINLSDPKIRTLWGQSSGQEVTYSIDTTEGDIYPEALDLSGDAPKFTLVVRDRLVLHGQKPVTIPAMRVPLELSTPGLHTVANAVACCAMALCQGLPPESLQVGLKRFRGLERRFELIYDEAFRIIDDHFANMNNIDVSLGSLAAMHYRKLHLVYAIRGSRGVTVNRENVQTLAKWLPRLNLDEIIVTETRGEVTAKDLVLPEEKAVFFEEIAKTPLAVSYRETMDDALAYALSQAEPGDIIFLAGTQGMDMGGRKILELIAARDPGQRSQILLAVADRVCG